jgi:hypothetical protein
MSATYMNYEALREVFPSIEIECFIQKPIETKDLLRKIRTEIEESSFIIVSIYIHFYLVDIIFLLN